MLKSQTDGGFEYEGNGYRKLSKRKETLSEGIKSTERNDDATTTERIRLKIYRKSYLILTTYREHLSVVCKGNYNRGCSIKEIQAAKDKHEDRKCLRAKLDRSRRAGS